MQDTVDRIQTESGIKDKTTTYWVERVVDMARTQVNDRIKSEKTRDPILSQRLSQKERTRTVKAIKKDIQVNTFHWLISQPPDRYAALPVDSRTSGNPVFHLYSACDSDPPQLQGSNSVPEIITMSS